MKKLIVLSTLLLTATFSLTSCDKKTGTEGEPTEPVATEATTDTVPQTQDTDSETPIATPAPATATGDTLTQNK